MPRRATAKAGLIFDTTDEYKTSATGLTCFGTECPTLGAKAEGQNLATRPEADGRTKEPWNPTRDRGRSSETAERREGGCVRKDVREKSVRKFDILYSKMRRKRRT